VLFSLFAVKFSSIVFIIVSGLIGIIAFYGKSGKKEAKK
jgi:hypothetical protein